ncbi:MAG: hypothetical protein IT267_00500 [Saprospiraceae bacterium]|nr:hypothetical protein [Saprospiraceae bacterium]
MKYYSFDYDWENFPKGSGIEGVGGEMLKEEEQVIKESFWDAYCKPIKNNTFVLEPSLNYLKYKPSRNFLNEDLIGDLFGIGIVISLKFKNVINNFKLGSHNFIDVYINYKNNIITDYSFFYSKKRNYDIIDFNKSRFYEPINYKSLLNPKNYENSLIEIANEKELLHKINNNSVAPAFYELIIQRDQALDILDLGVINSTYCLFIFSERLVDAIIKENITNIKFSLNDRIKILT